MVFITQLSRVLFKASLVQMTLFLPEYWWFKMAELIQCMKTENTFCKDFFPLFLYWPYLQKNWTNFNISEGILQWSKPCFIFFKIQQYSRKLGFALSVQICSIIQKIQITRHSNLLTINDTFHTKLLASNEVGDLIPALVKVISIQLLNMTIKCGKSVI